MSDWSIPLSRTEFDADEEEAVVRVVRGDWHSMGPEVGHFEKEFSGFMEVKHSVGVSSASGALHLGFKALDIGPGDEVIQPALNFVASANITLAVGATPVFADINSLDEPTIAPAEILEKITSKTKAVVVMHYGGYFCRMEEIHEICRDRGLALIEDACHALTPGKANGNGNGNGHTRAAGDYGDVSCYSFYSNKNIATGEGGMACTNRDDLAERLRLLRSHGISKGAWQRHNNHDLEGYDVLEHGLNYRMDEFRAALGRVQLGKLPQLNEKRANVVQHYVRRLSNAPNWKVPFSGYNGESAHHLMVVVASNEDIRKNALVRFHDEKIQTSHHYPSVPNLKAFRDYKNGGLEKSDSFSSLAMTLPLYPGLMEDEVDRICDILLDV